MQARLSEILRVDNQVYGLVSDKAHKMFHNQGKLLMTTSTYLPVIKQWLPVLYSFMNGLTSEHYCHHFLVLFQTLTRQRHEDGLQVTDEDFTMVIDFSSAERNGFLQAYIDLHCKTPGMICKAARQVV
ncbi:hypothetical protein BDV98DRAFT_596999 [Pterulicium gracile]|uniref:MULE transposase domain-containing protein n=1 Tax=Pterulicium gracile TaxID=1884261 RepID=A0A5C3Q9J0_9AGAR|nr:hypothetical protein BDV98DRAFT_596999 [Pterula gracilis]